MVKRIFLVFLLLSLVALAKTVYQYLAVAGKLQSYQPVLAEQCDKIPLSIDAELSLGTEDIEIDRETGLVMITGMNRFEYGTENQDPVDGIYGLVINPDGSSDAKELSLLSVDAPVPFHPHGIGLWQGETRQGVIEKRLFVVNHRSHHDKAIEIFRVTTDLKLAHIETITSPEIYSPNDVAPVGEVSFYVTNDAGRGDGLIRTLEQYLFLPRSGAAFYDGEKAFEVVAGQVYANGINTSADFKSVYLVNASAQKINAFERQSDNSLRHTKTFKLNTAPDNVNVAADGSLWIGAHAKLFDYLSYTKKKQPTAPSHVVRIDPVTGESETILYTENGELSASSAAATYAGRLLVGSVYEGAILSCPYPN